MIAKSLAKQPDDRYQSGRELSEAAAAALAGRAHATPRRRRRVLRPRRRLLLAVAAVLAAVAAALVAFFALRGDEGGEVTGSPGQGQEASVSDPPTIVPGQSIGAVSLGMSQQQVVRALGDPPSEQEWASRGQTGSTATYTLRDAPFRVSYYDGKVVMVSTQSDDYQTDAGIGAGLRAPNPTIPVERKQALRTGELQQIGKGRYSWRGFVFDGQVAYCSSGNGGTTVLVTRQGSPEIRIVNAAFLPDQSAMERELALQPLAPCANLL